MYMYIQVDPFWIFDCRDFFVTALSFFITGEVSHLERGQIHERIKPDFNLMNDRVVPLELDPLGSPNDPDLVQCSSSALQNDTQQPDAQETPTSLSKQGVIVNGACGKVCLRAFSGLIISLKLISVSVALSDLEYSTPPWIGY